MVESRMTYLKNKLEWKKQNKTEQIYYQLYWNNCTRLKKRACNSLSIAQKKKPYVPSVQ